MGNLKNFVCLNVEEKYKLIEEFGIFLMDRKEGNRKIFLYSFANIFCEVWILELLDHNDQLVTDIKLFDSVDFLAPYLKTLDLQNLY